MRLVFPRNKLETIELPTQPSPPDEAQPSWKSLFNYIPLEEMKNSDNFTISTNRVTAIVKSNSSVNVWIRVLKKLNLLSYYYNYYLLWWLWYECIMICLRDPPRGSCPLEPPATQSASKQQTPTRTPLVDSFFLALTKNLPLQTGWL